MLYRQKKKYQGVKNHFGDPFPDAWPWNMTANGSLDSCDFTSICRQLSATLPAPPPPTLLWKNPRSAPVTPAALTLVEPFLACHVS